MHNVAFFIVMLSVPIIGVIVLSVIMLSVMADEITFFPARLSKTTLSIMGCAEIQH
jgi:hypothetical protein